MQLLTFVGYYSPGFKGGGALRTIVNMVELLGKEIHFKIATKDRDLGDVEPYTTITMNSWQKVGNADVIYLSPQKISFSSLRSLILLTKHDIIYLNSFFSFNFSIMIIILYRFGLIPKKPLILAPRGEFSQGALKIKKLKKRLYLKFVKVLRIYKEVIWQASSDYEKESIQQIFGCETVIRIAPDIPTLIDFGEIKHDQICNKTKGTLSIIFLSRISRKKNLDTALKMIFGLRGRIQFNIFGPIEDKAYWKECQKIIKDLPENIEVQYRGCVPNDKVPMLMLENDLFFFPTLGENFGHVILEAFCAGCPVLISDQTPWRDLEANGVGWDLPLDRPDLFKDILQMCIDMNNLEYAKWAERAQAYGFQMTKDDKVVAQNRKLFHHALGIKSNRCQEKTNV